MEAKAAKLSRSALCFAVLIFIFLLQIIVIRDAGIWKVKLNEMLSYSLSQWNSEWMDASKIEEVVTCDRSHKDFDICTVNTTILLHRDSSTIFILGPRAQARAQDKAQAQPNSSLKIYPYPLKNDKSAISLVREITLTSSPSKATCGVTHHSPVLVFSAGGYTGNFYHDINENFIPLFITINSLFLDHDVVLVVTDGKTWWFQKYAKLLSAFSPNHPIINIKNITNTHCFPSATIGLIKHGALIIDPKLLPHPKTLVDFHDFLRKVYAKDNTTTLYGPKVKMGNRPNLTLITRRGNVSRVILNQDEIIKVAEEIGFNVHLFEPSRNTSMIHDYNLIHKSHVMLGVHGAGLTHLLFLRPGSILVQVVPIGTEWASRTYYEKPTKILGLEYIGYKIEANESTLLEMYGANSLVMKDPSAFHENNWSKKRIYLRKQSVKLDVVRFRKCLIKAYEKAKIFMDKVG